MSLSASLSVRLSDFSSVQSVRPSVGQAKLKRYFSFCLDVPTSSYPFLTTRPHPLSPPPSGIMTGVGIFLNFFVWGVHSSGAIPFLSLLQLLSMWICVSLPLLFLGFFFGFRKRPYTQPVRTNQIPRQVPDQDWYKNTLTTTVLSGRAKDAFSVMEVL